MDDRGQMTLVCISLPGVIKKNIKHSQGAAAHG
jgi:hypothetical protein